MNIKQISQIKNRSAFFVFIEDSFLVESKPDVLSEVENLRVPVEVQNVEVPVVNVVIAKNVAITKAKLQTIAKLVANVAQAANDDDTVVEVVTRKRKGRPTLAKSALKLDKLQQIEKNKPLVAKRESIRNLYNNFCFLYFLYNAVLYKSNE